MVLNSSIENGRDVEDPCPKTEEKSDQESASTSRNIFLDPTQEQDEGEDNTIKPLVIFRERLYNLFHLPKFQVFIVGLVILDSLLVVSELIIDLEILAVGHDNAAPHVLHYMSIAILSFFIIELCFKLYAYGLEFFLHKLEVFDAVVVILSFSLDVAFRNDESALNAVGLLIILRLWRIARVLNGIVLSVKIQAEHKLAKERKKRHDVEQDYMKCQDYVTNLEEEINFLRTRLVEMGMKDLPPSTTEQSHRENKSNKR